MDFNVGDRVELLDHADHPDYKGHGQVGTVTQILTGVSGLHVGVRWDNDYQSAHESHELGDVDRYTDHPDFTSGEEVEQWLNS